MSCNASRPGWHGSLPCKQRSRPLVPRISEDADPTQIKRAYRKLALKHHPDISDLPSAQQDFVRIQEAYEMLTNKKEAAQADPTGKGWDFHDWYWDFMSSSRWNSQWKKHAQAGPSPFAATPSHRDQWHAQLGRLKQKAAFRRAKQQAQQQTHTPEQQHPHSASAPNAAHHQSRTKEPWHSQPTPAPNTAQHAHHEAAQQHGSQQASEIEAGHCADHQSVGSTATERSSGRMHSETNHSTPSDHTSSLCFQQREASGVMQHSEEPADTQASKFVKESAGGDAQPPQQINIPAQHESRIGHVIGQADSSQRVVFEGTDAVAHEELAQLPQPMHESNSLLNSEAAEQKSKGVEYAVNSHSEAPTGHVSYSHEIDEVSKTTERVHSQLIGLKRRAARKA